MDTNPVAKKKFIPKLRAIQSDDQSTKKQINVSTLQICLNAKLSELKEYRGWNKSSNYETGFCQIMGWTRIDQSDYDCTWTISNEVILIELKKSKSGFWINSVNLARLYKKSPEERNIFMIFLKLGQRNRTKVLSKIYIVHAEKLIEFTNMKTMADHIIAIDEYYKKFDIKNNNQLSIKCNMLDKICDGYIEC